MFLLVYWCNLSYIVEVGKILYFVKDKCGLLWYVLFIFVNKDVMILFIDMVCSIMVKYNIELLIIFIYMLVYNIDSIVFIIFDLINEKVKVDVYVCLDVLFVEGVKWGFVFYWLNIK